MGESAILTMDADGSVVIPETILQAQHLHPGDQLFIFEDETGITLMSGDQPNPDHLAGSRCGMRLA